MKIKIEEKILYTADYKLLKKILIFLCQKIYFLKKVSLLPKKKLKRYLMFLRFYPILEIN
jgi:hypothetical protein